MESLRTPSTYSLPEILRQRAQVQPDQLAFRFLLDGTSDHAVDWTYQDVAERADTVASQLRAKGVESGRVMLALDPGLDYVAGLFGILQAGCTAVPSFPPFGRRATGRFLSILADCAPGAVLTDPRFAGQVTDYERELPASAPSLEWIFPDQTFFERKADAAPAPFHVVEPALLQYSSGSTGDPKGIVLSHENLVSNCRVLEAHMGMEPDRVGCSWLPPYHDMGLMGTIMLAVHGGWPLVMLSPVHFVQDPYRWLKAITDHKVTISVGPNFAFDLCASSITDEEIQTLDLSTLRQVFCGSEPVSSATLSRFEERFGESCGFDSASMIPCYGMAEATLFVSGKPEKSDSVRTARLDKRALELGEARHVASVSDADADADAVDVVSCGVIAEGHDVLVAHPETSQRLRLGEVGEIWVSGPSVALGYLNRPELTAETFDVRPPGEPGAAGYLRTGDLGFLLDGELYVVGRLKDLIVMSGRNLYPQDIEESIGRSHDALRRSAVFSVDGPNQAGDSDEERMVVVTEYRGTTKEFAAEEAVLRGRVIEAVTADHGVRPTHLHFGPVGTILMTTSGKVRRRATKAAFLDGTLKAFSPTKDSSEATAVVS